MNYLRSRGRRTKCYQNALRARAEVLARMWTRHDRKMLAFYSQFIMPGDLCFDIGANRGSRTKIFLKLGARVIAVEPQVSCADLLEKHYGDKEDVTVIQKALGAHVGLGEMMLCAANPISSLSESWIQAVQASGRFPLHAWGKKQLVQITTLDDLIAYYGQPSFIKIDVEGYEYEVLQGLSQPVKALSLELISEYLDATRQSIAHLQTLGEPTFNYALGETMQLILDSWVTAREIMTRLSQLENISGLSGDLYIRYSDS